MVSYSDPTWPPGSDELEALCSEGHLRRTFVRLAPSRRQSILDAALEEAAAHGPANLNIKAVAERANVPVGSLYQYFGDRDTLVRLSCVLASRRIAAILAFATPYLTELPLEEALRVYLEQSLAWCKSEPTLMRLYCTAAYNVAFRREPISVAANDPDAMVVTAVAESIRKISEVLLAAASQRKELRQGVDIDKASRILNVLLIAVTDAALLPGLNAYYQLYDTRHGHNSMMQAAVDFACRGLLRTAEKRGRDSKQPARAKRPARVKR